MSNDMDLTIGENQEEGSSDAGVRTAQCWANAVHGAVGPASRFYAGSADYPPAGSRESIGSGRSARDRKRRLTSASEDARLQRTRSSGTDSRSDIHAWQTLPYRSASMLDSSSRRASGYGNSAPPGSSYATAIDISSSPPGSDSPSAFYGQAESSRMASSRTRLDDHGDWSMNLPRRRPAAGSRGITLSNGSFSMPLREGSAMARQSQELGDGGGGLVDMTMPRWQPDSEVTSCPICGKMFSFWYRKHHCRKCGRVVCASCSPHRITIPRQYIVRPSELTELAESSSNPTHPVVDLTEEPPTPSSPTNPSSSSPPTPSISIINPALGGGEEVRLCNPCVPDPNPNPLGYAAIRPRGHRSTQSLSFTMGNHWSRPTRGGTGASDSRPMWISHNQLVAAEPRCSQACIAHASQFNPLFPPSATPQASQRPAVSEQDTCPVCRRGFPPLTNEQPLEAREAHIRSCIDNYGAPGQQQPTSTSQAPPAVATRMLEFTATEKDCLGSDGNGNLAECTICMEEYEVGQALARLECLCKFHRKCISGWFERKMECPVHKGS
ncbi:hypothetical protein N7492_004110 [Penicillium capsulatum]|uniref:RING-type E3 ubiquitin transferase n=1 Tax=Penicillium capsulatum TaxID=69766 RepID=A0A9W9IPW1_9EURO|nr:hypothetical protein N7492_004110 [Penicillium capsulatum]